MIRNNMDNPDTQTTTGTKHKAETNKTQRPKPRKDTQHAVSQFFLKHEDEFYFFRKKKFHLERR